MRACVAGRLPGSFCAAGESISGLPSGRGELHQLEFLDLRGEGIDAGLRRFHGLGLGGRREIERGRDGAAAAAAAARAAGLGHLVEDVVEREVVGLLDRIELVVVAARAGEREAHPDGRGGLDAIEDILDARLLGDAAALAVEHVVAVKTARDERAAARRVRGQRVGVRGVWGLGFWVWVEEIAGELLDRKLIVGHVRIKRVHDPVAPRPHRALGIALEAVGVGVAREVEPVPGPALAVARRGEQAIDGADVGVGRAVGEKRVQLGGRGRHAGEIEGDAAEQRGGGGLGGGREFFLRELGADEGVDGIRGRTRRRVDGGMGRIIFLRLSLSPCLRVSDARHGRSLRFGKRPVRPPGRAGGDPVSQQVDLDGLELAGALPRGHDLVLLLARDAVEELAFLRVAGRDDGDVVARAEEPLALIEPELGLAARRIGAMAVEARVREDWEDLPIEVDRLGGARGERGAEGKEEQPGEKEKA